MTVKSSSKPNATLAILWRCLRYLRPYGKLVLGIYLAMAAINAIQIILPQFVRWIIDRGIYGDDERLLGLSVLGLLGITVIKGLFTYLLGGWTESASQNAAYDLRNEIQHKLDRLPFSFHDQAQSGQILSRAIQDVERIRFLTGRALLRIVEGLVLMIGTAVVLIWMNASLGLLVALTMPLILHRAFIFGRLFRPLSFKIQDQLGVLTARVEQNLRGAQVVKGFAQEDAEIERFQDENRTWFDLSARGARIQAINEPMMDMIANFGAVIILWFGGILAVRGQLTLGELVAFTTYLAQLVRPLRLMGRIVPVFAIAASAGERIFEILDAHEEIRDADDPIEGYQVQGRVSFEQVSFGYNHRMVIQDVSFDVQPGQVVALLGETGSGKTTVINLVARFYDPIAGRILIDGYDARQLSLQSLRVQTGIVMQDTRLFGASIRENITFGRPKARQEEIEAAARDAQAHDFIAAMPDGYDTHVGERGVTLSGGQKQRIAIARALLTNPRILILDDATSSVDAETERFIQMALARLMHGRTTFVIAHRLSTVRQADLILVLKKGRVVARGTHQSLLVESPDYAEIYQLQLRPQSVSLKGRDL